MWFGSLARFVDFRNRRLHAIGHFTLGDAGLDCRIETPGIFDVMQFAQVIEQPAATRVSHTLRIGQIQHRVATRAKLNTLMLSMGESRSPTTGSTAAALPCSS